MSKSSPTLTQAQAILTRAACVLAPVAKESMEMWLQIADALPRHEEHPHTVAATDLVQAALQEAPWPMQHTETRQLGWLQKHLPGVRAALQRSVSSQLDIMARRMIIIQSLARSQQQSSSTQTVANLASEFKTYVMVEAFACVFSIALPLDALCSGLSCSAQAKQEGRKMQLRPRKQQQSLQQGSELLSRVGCFLKRSSDVRSVLGRKQQQTYGQLVHLCRQVGVELQDVVMSMHVQSHTDVWQQINMACKLAGKASLVWLFLVSQLPPSHSDTQLFLDQVEWKPLSYFRSEHHHTDAVLKPALMEILSSTVLLTRVWDQHPDLAGCLLRYIGLTDHLCSLGLSAKKQKQILAGLQESELCVRDGTLLEPSFVQALSFSSLWLPAASNDSTTSRSRRVEEDTLGSSAADNEAGKGEGCDLGDMQALLQMMYGCTV